MDEQQNILTNAINSSANLVFKRYGSQLSQTMLGRMKSAMINAANSVGDTAENFEWRDPELLEGGRTIQECILIAAGKYVHSCLKGDSE